MGTLIVAFVVFLVFSRLRPSRRVSSDAPKGKRVVVITGCDSGFGQGLVSSSLDRGFEVVAACFTREKAEEYETSENANIHGVRADLATDAGVATVVKKALGVCGGRGLHALVNNAGMVIPGNAEWAKPPTYELTMKLNFHAPVSLTYSLLPALKSCPSST